MKNIRIIFGATTIILLLLSGRILSSIIGLEGVINIAQQVDKNYIKTEKNSDLEEVYSSTLLATNDSTQVTLSINDLNTLIDTKVEEKIKNINVGSVPEGTVISYMGNHTPGGYLNCNGTVYNISQYQNLADYIKNQFGTYNYFGGDGTITFAVPDLRGEFLRGTGTAARNTGSGATVGVHQNATTHTFISTNSDGALQVYFATVGTVIANYDKTVNNSSSGLTGYRQNFSTSYGSGVKFSAYTSRPTNTSVLYCIKY